MAMANKQLQVSNWNRKQKEGNLRGMEWQNRETVPTEEV